MIHAPSLLDRAHRFSTRNFDDAKRSTQCACFSCLSVFSAEEVLEGSREVEGRYVEIDGALRADQITATCPRCGLDAVLPDNSGLPIFDQSFLAAMQSRWIWQIDEKELHAAN